MQITIVIDMLQALTVNHVLKPHCPYPPPCFESWTSVAITSIICATILIVAIVGMTLFFVWKAKGMKAQKQAAIDKRTQDIEDRRIVARAKLLEKVLIFKESRTKTENADKLSVEECKAYEELLEKELKKFDDILQTNIENGTKPTKK